MECPEPPRLETPSTSLVRTQTEGLMHDVYNSCTPQEKPNMSFILQTLFMAQGHTRVSRIVLDVSLALF